MWWRAEEKVSQLNNSVSQSFGRVRHDTDKLFQWVAYLASQNKDLQQQMQALHKHAKEWQSYGEKLHSRLQSTHSRVIDAVDKVREVHTKHAAIASQLSSLHHEVQRTNVRVAQIPAMTANDIKRVVDAHYSFDSIAGRLRSVEERISTVETQRLRSPVAQKPAVSRPVQSSQMPKPVSHLQEKVMRGINKHSKAYIKSALLSLVNKYERLSGLQLREMVVDEQGLCSKSSFYRLLTELEDEKNIDVSVDGKEKLYSAKNSKPRIVK
jgi:uncharacterized protein (DUF3084 family)